MNLAIAAVDAELVAITDDDCEVPRDWLVRFARAFALDPRVAIVFGNVRAAAHDARDGFVPAYARTEPFIAKKPLDKWQIEGLGACMAIRRAAWEALGGFDEMLGPGAPYPAAGEGDLVLRALRAGWWVYETPDIEVLHHGFRSRREGRDLVAGYARGTGAMMAKHIRCRSPGARRLLARMALRWLRRGRPEALHLGSNDAWTSRLGSFAAGFLAGARTPIDRERWLFEDTRASRVA
jgi:GT2 family glycosyltransferase